MKHKITLLFIVTSSLFFTSCASIPPIVTTDPADNSTVPSDVQYKEIEEAFHAYLPIANQIIVAAGRLAIQAALDDEDRKEKAEMVSGSGHLFTYLFGGTKVPSKEEIEQAFSAYFPTSKTHWANYALTCQGVANAISIIFGGYTGLILEAGQNLAQDAYEAAEPFL